MPLDFEQLPPAQQKRTICELCRLAGRDHELSAVAVGCYDVYMPVSGKYVPSLAVCATCLLLHSAVYERDDGPSRHGYKRKRGPGHVCRREMEAGQ